MPPRRRISVSAPTAAFILHLLLLSAASASDAGCDVASSPDPAAVRHDRLTVLLSGHSHLRLPLLRRVAASYSSHPLVAAVLVVWSNPTTSHHLLKLHFPSSPAKAAPISVHRTATTSLNSRFLPRAAILTAAVAVADDDILPDHDAISFAFATWQHQPNPNRALVGFFARSHDLDLAHREWVYTAAQPGRYSMVLTKLAVLPVALLRRYSCSPELAAARRHVDAVRNCEDILMNFVAAMDAGVGPVLVEAGTVRDFGDPRNDDVSNGDGGGEEEVKSVGLSARGEFGHWRKRGECITEFHRLLGRMPLKHSYGKVVEAAVGEQGLCRKAGRLVRCDRD